jgi:hypothetical protein
MDDEIQRESTERVRWAVAADGDPRTDVVEIAFTATGVRPAAADWFAGSWEASTIELRGETRYVAAILIGPVNGVIELGPGAWQAWIRVTDDPAVPVLHLGTVIID